MLSAPPSSHLSIFFFSFPSLLHYGSHHPAQVRPDSEGKILGLLCASQEPALQRIDSEGGSRVSPQVRERGRWQTVTRMGIRSSSGCVCSPVFTSACVPLPGTRSVPWLPLVPQTRRSVFVSPFSRRLGTGRLANMLFREPRETQCSFLDRPQGPHSRHRESRLQPSQRCRAVQCQ